jgi:hypothetical protein
MPLGLLQQLSHLHRLPLALDAATSNSYTMRKRSFARNMFQRPDGAQRRPRGGGSILPAHPANSRMRFLNGARRCLAYALRASHTR